MLCPLVPAISTWVGEIYFLANFEYVWKNGETLFLTSSFNDDGNIDWLALTRSTGGSLDLFPNQKLTIIKPPEHQSHSEEVKNFSPIPFPFIFCLLRAYLINPHFIHLQQRKAVSLSSNEHIDSVLYLL